MADYYAIDDIIAEEDIVSIVFQKAVNGVGIDPSAETDCVSRALEWLYPFGAE
ncbi:hypothetical protein TorRG33x02_014730 [Trema orientale]|uniref:Uncharacterized protein n=1 Tax=Trema orientale TaxID=63057 RepID=A0A2P5FXI1_TREOI|nr:hypothetical protein TorRG33x02_014730 [Trema orientale]